MQNAYLNDTVMAAGCLKGQPGAQKALYDTYSAKMMAVCYRYANNKADAEDMLQESFIRVFQQIHQYSGKGSLEGWIRKVVVHTSINYLKKNKKFREYLDIVAIGELLVKEEKITAYIHGKQIIECIRLLPIGYKTVLNLFAIEGYSHKEIAGMLDIEESTSRSQYLRAKNMLEKILLRNGVMAKEENKQRS